MLAIRPTRLVLFVLGPILAGCGAEPGPCDSLPMDGASVEIGGAPEGALGFEPFDDGADRPLVRGSQGGYHVWLNVRARGLCPTSTRLELRVFEESTDTMVVFQSLPAHLEPSVDVPDSADLPRAIAMIICPALTDGVPVADAVHSVDLSLTDADGRRAEASRRFVPRCDPAVQGGAFLADCRCQCGLVCE